MSLILLPTGEEMGVLGIRSIYFAMLSSCQDMKNIAL